LLLGVTALWQSFAHSRIPVWIRKSITTSRCNRLTAKWQDRVWLFGRQAAQWQWRPRSTFGFTDLSI